MNRFFPVPVQWTLHNLQPRKLHHGRKHEVEVEDDVRFEERRTIIVIVIVVIVIILLVVTVNTNIAAMMTLLTVMLLCKYYMPRAGVRCRTSAPVHRLRLRRQFQIQLASFIVSSLSWHR